MLMAILELAIATASLIGAIAAPGIISKMQGL
jgi:hypothetical protein